MTTDPTLCLTPECTLVYPSLFEPSSFKTEEPTYSGTFLIPKNANIDNMRNAVKAAATQKWGTQISFKSLRLPVRDGDEKAIDENGNTNKDNFYYNQYFVRAKSKWQPPIVNIYNDPITDENEIYGGCIVRAYFSFYGYDYMGNKGIGCGLRAVCKVADGPPLGGGRIDTSEVFNSVLVEKEKFENSIPDYDPDSARQDEPFYHGDDDSISF
jgi:hypothetical protein